MVSFRKILKTYKCSLNSSIFSKRKILAISEIDAVSEYGHNVLNMVD